MFGLKGFDILTGQGEILPAEDGDGGSGGGSGGGGGWDLRTFLENVFETIGEWFGLAAMILGIAAIAWAIWLIVTGLMSQGRKQVNWAMCLILLFVGGALSVSTGFEFFRGIAEGGTRTIEDLGGQTITFLQFGRSFLP